VGSVSTEPLRIAMIGCGAVAERGHLPAVAKSDSCTISVLVDPNKDRTEELAAKFEVENVSAGYDEVAEVADAAILALPHNLHAKAATYLLERGVHVLVEKPMATTLAECKEMVTIAERNSRVLAVGHMKRFLHNAALAKWVVESDMLGSITRFDFQEGNVYNWPVQSAFFFKKEAAGGGVLFDAGAHVIDLMLWWFGEVKSLEYRDDAFGGVEADCQLTVETDSGIVGAIELSRTRNLRNTAIIQGERATLEVDLRKNWAVIHSPNGTVGLNGMGADPGTLEANSQGFDDLFDAQIEDFVDSIRDSRSPTATGADATRTVELIERCYRERRPLELPWLRSLKELASV
jgi:predicted dehydrogenase